MTVCPGAGHMLMMERPDEVNAAVTGVLRRVLAEAPHAIPAETDA
ncbi:hypothetical protein NKG94_46040 [Micromonospora sp. M12]